MSTNPIPDLDELLSRHSVPGVSVAIYEKGKQFLAATGLANTNTSVAVTPNSVMHLGSITKIFTASLVMQLVDEGLIELDRPAVHYLPELKLRSAEALPLITIRMLLNHTSGIDGSTPETLDRDEETIEKGVRRMRDRGQVHRPGEEYSYTNSAFVIAGYLTQRLTGIGWHTLMRRRIFELLGLASAITAPEDALGALATVGHFTDPSHPAGARPARHPFQALSYSPSSSSLMMTAGDLLTFVTSQFCDVNPVGNRVISRASAELMSTPSVSLAKKGYAYLSAVGLGWMLSDDGLLYHAGGGPGFVATVYAYPKNSWAAVVLTNGDTGLGVVNDIMRPLLAAHGHWPLLGDSPAGSVSTSKRGFDATGYVGRFANSLDRFDITATDTGLRMSRIATYPLYEVTKVGVPAWYRLDPCSDHQFIATPEEGDPGKISVVAFRNPSPSGKFEHMGTGLRLYPRVPHA